MSLSRHPLTPSTQGLANVPVDSGTAALLAASFRAIQVRGQDFADGFYARLFAAHPQVRAMFPADMTAQKAKLLDTLAVVMAHLQDPQGNIKRLQELGLRHVAYGARPEHFPLVIDAMLASMQAVAGPEWNKAVHEQWRRALNLIGEVMINAGFGQGSPPATSRDRADAPITPPLKRHPSLQPFSREHMSGLVLARNLRRRPLDDSARMTVVTEFMRGWERELAPHFADEERILLPIITDATLGDRLLAEHARLRELAVALPSSAQPRTEQLMQQLGELLEDHIRWEERVLFETIQAQAPEALAKLHAHAEAIERDRPGARPRRSDRS